MTRSTDPLWRSRTKTSETPFVSPGTRFDANESNTTYRPSALKLGGSTLLSFACTPVAETLIRSVTPGVALPGDAVTPTRPAVVRSTAAPRSRSASVPSNCRPSFPPLEVASCYSSSRPRALFARAPALQAHVTATSSHHEGEGLRREVFDRGLPKRLRLVPGLDGDGGTSRSASWGSRRSRRSSRSA